jgi:hypothetical protein
MNFRNPVYTANTWISCEIEHPTLGWIPFLADPNDTGAEFDVAELYDRMTRSPSIQPYVPPVPVPPTMEEQEAARKVAYVQEADPLFFMFQRGEATEQEWLDKVAEIKARYPYPVE